MCFNFLTGRTGPSVGPTSSADKAAGRLVDFAGPATAVNPPTAAQRATQNQQTADRNTMRRADSYGKSASSATQPVTSSATQPKTTVPGAQKIKQTFQQPIANSKQPVNDGRTAQRLADRAALKKKRKRHPTLLTSAGVGSWQGTQARSGKTILGA